MAVGWVAGEMVAEFQEGSVLGEAVGRRGDWVGVVG